ncbi:UbiA prenyltransferase family protein [Hamadaea tsunoensis]|uniref:UbiA prenyltransferase family protein n=1 Tax=Hamadaea tsunoensis TaxID=53368 RepID=UPI00040D2E33|nr:UbiA prenyltransferase family protein [Hamadaea tsunoensis]
MDQTLTEALDTLPAVPTTAISTTATATTAVTTWGRLSAYVALLRPRHWVKGSLVLVGPLVTGPVRSWPHLATLLLTLAAFLLAASTVYVLNDLRDRESDRLHPLKRLRPIASGRVSPAGAVWLLAAMGTGMAGVLVLLPRLVAVIVVAYLLMNVWYSFALKRQPLVDVSVVATGFVLRVLAGTVAAGLAPQPFLLIAVYGACMALSLGKRRHELSATTDAAVRHRPALSAYSVSFLDHVVVVNLVAALVGYVAFLWPMRPPYGPVTAVLTFPFATYTIFRYLQMLMVERSGGDPVEDLIRDRPLLVNVGIWGVILLPVLVVSAL